MSGARKAILFSGPPCSGKSTLAERFSAKSGIPLLQKDEFVARLFPGSSNGIGDRDVAYRALHLTAEVLLGAGHPVVIDGVYERRESREGLRATIEKTGSLLYLITCKVTPEEAARRFAARRTDHPAVDLAVQTVRQKAFEYPFSGLGLEIPTNECLGKCLASIERYLVSGDPISSGAWCSTGSSSPPI